MAADGSTPVTGGRAPRVRRRAPRCRSPHRQRRVNRVLQPMRGRTRDHHDRRSRCRRRPPAAWLPRLTIPATLSQAPRGPVVSASRPHRTGAGRRPPRRRRRSHHRRTTPTRTAAGSAPGPGRAASQSPEAGLVVLGYGQDAGGRGWNRLALPERAALQLLGHSTLEASAGLIGHRPDLLAQLLVRRHHHHLLDAYPPSVRSHSRMAPGGVTTGAASG